jgi:hypothetical protein
LIGVDDCHTDDLLRVRVWTEFEAMTPIIGQLIGGVSVVGESKVTVHQ